MQTFTRHRSVDEIKGAAAKRAGFIVNTDRYDSGSDFINVCGTFGDKRALLLYSSFNGRFFGETTDGLQISSDSAEYDGEPWFQAMLSFFYAGAVAA